MVDWLLLARGQRSGLFHLGELFNKKKELKVWHVELDLRSDQNLNNFLKSFFLYLVMLKHAETFFNFTLGGIYSFQRLLKYTVIIIIIIIIIIRLLSLDHSLSQHVVRKGEERLKNQVIFYFCSVKGFSCEIVFWTANSD